MLELGDERMTAAACGMGHGPAAASLVLAGGRAAK
jgi:hypothetical protein